MCVFIRFDRFDRFYLLLYPHWVNSLFQGDSLYTKLTLSFIPNTSCLPATYRLTHFVRSNTPFTSITERLLLCIADFYFPLVVYQHAYRLMCNSNVSYWHVNIIVTCNDHNYQHHILIDFINLNTYTLLIGFINIAFLLSFILR